MKRWKKITLGIVAALAVLLIGGVAVAFGYLDSIVKSTVEKESTAQLKLATNLQDADVSVFGGKVTLDGLKIANPEGFVAPNLFELGKVDVGVNYGELTKEPIRIKQINVNGPKLTIERGSVGGMAEQLQLNLQKMLANLDTSGDSAKLIIDELAVNGTEVVIRPNLDIEGVAEQYTLKIPNFTMKGIGTADEAQNGVEIGRVLTDMVMTMARQALDSEELPPEARIALSGDLKGAVAQYGDKIKGQVRDELNKQLGDIGEQLGGEAGKLLDGALQGDPAKGLDDAAKDAGQKAQDEIGKRLGGLLGGGGGGGAKEEEKKDGGQ